MSPQASGEVPCMPASAVDVSETMGLIIFILNILSGGLGTFVSSIIDKKGCNCTAFLVSIL